MKKGHGFLFKQKQSAVTVLLTSIEHVSQNGMTAFPAPHSLADCTYKTQH